MKNTLSVFLAFAFSLLGVVVNAQTTYEPAPFWGATEVSRTVGNLTKVMSYDFGANTYTRRVVVNAAPFGIPNYGDYSTIAYEGPLTGSGIDTVSLNLALSPNLGWRAWVRILDANYDDVIPPVLLFNQVQPLTPLQINFPDPLYGYDGSLASRSISYNPTINSYFNPPDGENYTNIFNVRVACTNCPSNYDVTRTQAYNNFPSFQSFVAHFNLPQDLSGEWCLDAWVSVTHNSVTPKYWVGEKVQWTFFPPCFYWSGDITTSVGDVSEKEGLKAFPNPTTDGLVTVTSPEVTNYALLNTTGQQIAAGRLVVGENRLDQLSGLSSGIYILHTDAGNSIRIVKE